MVHSHFLHKESDSCGLPAGRLKKKTIFNETNKEWDANNLRSVQVAFSLLEVILCSRVIVNIQYIVCDYFTALIYRVRLYKTICNKHTHTK